MSLHIVSLGSGKLMIQLLRWRGSRTMIRELVSQLARERVDFK